MKEEEGTDKEGKCGQTSESSPSDIPKGQERFLIRIPVRRNPKLKNIIERINTDDELYTLWQVINNNAVKRLGMSDHGPVHVQIVTNIALKFLRLLTDRGIKPTCIVDYNLSIEDAEVIFALAALLQTWECRSTVLTTNCIAFSLQRLRSKNS